MNDSRWKMPPIEKIYEAFSAISDDRVKMLNGYAIIQSSDSKKEYTVSWDQNQYASNDNASYFQGYMGYPIIAVLMLQGRLKYTPAIAEYFKGVPWKELNKKHKNKYGEVVGVIIDELKAKGVDVAIIEREVEGIFKQVKALNLIYKKSKIYPPK